MSDRTAAEVIAELLDGGLVYPIPKTVAANLLAALTEEGFEVIRKVDRYKPHAYPADLPLVPVDVGEST